MVLLTPAKQGIKRQAQAAPKNLTPKKPQGQISKTEVIEARLKIEQRATTPTGSIFPGNQHSLGKIFLLLQQSPTALCSCFPLSARRVWTGRYLFKDYGTSQNCSGLRIQQFIAVMRLPDCLCRNSGFPNWHHSLVRLIQGSGGTILGLLAHRLGERECNGLRRGGV